MKYLCPHCKKMKPATHFACEMSSKGGSAKTDAKAEAARVNGAKGGRPRTKKP